ncbi:DUF6378 domain-containing protein [Mannheimia bovis]|uniref:DUF6378 domain-containing protein n=1 Tax=Mannheimia bovis TaxID=2770636 RepID=UPI0024B717F4|nr:DUF6378 domain-containing protein [Mannheimia bovis]WHP46409.1 DUF6378 domain-containing protein [Mannheimia bovis]
MKTTQDILDEREQQYGSYDTFAKIYGGLRKVSDQHAEKLTWQQQAAVEMVLLKLARILNNGANHQDNWQDIAGYAMLGGNIYTPKLPDNAQGLPKPLTDSIYPESHLNRNS